MPTEMFYVAYYSLTHVAIHEHGYSSTFTQQQMRTDIGVTWLITVRGGAKSTKGIKTQVKESIWKGGKDGFESVLYIYIYIHTHTTHTIHTHTHTTEHTHTHTHHTHHTHTHHTHTHTTHTTHTHTPAVQLFLKNKTLIL